METPTVDIVIPVYNMGRTFLRTLESIEQSAYQQRQLIVVDDGSEDGETEDILKLLKGRIDVLERIPHGGKTAAANRGGQLGTSELIIFIDADTYVVPDFIEQIIDEFSSDIGAIDFVLQVANPLDSFWTRMAAFERELLAVVPDNFGALFAIRRSEFEAGPFKNCLSPQFEINDRLRNAGKLLISSRKLAFSDEPTSLSRTYRRKRRWVYGWLQSCHMHGQAVDFHILMPLIDVLLFSLICVGPWFPELLLFPVGLFLVWLGKSLCLARQLRQSSVTAVLYPIFMLVLCTAAVEAFLRFRLRDRQISWT